MPGALRPVSQERPTGFLPFAVIAATVRILAIRIREGPALDVNGRQMRCTIGAAWYGIGGA